MLFALDYETKPQTVNKKIFFNPLTSLRSRAEELRFRLGFRKIFLFTVWEIAIS